MAARTGVSMNLARWWRHTDRVLIVVTAVLACIGLLMIGSATHINREGLRLYDFVEKQSGFLVGITVLVSYLMRYDYRKLFRWTPLLYLFNIAALAAVMVVGTSALGAQRWIQLGPISVQPSEFAKLLYLICLARFLCWKKIRVDTWRGLIAVGSFLALPIALVFLQPDLGTSLVFGAITLGMTAMAGLRWTHLRNLLGVFFASSPLVWFFLLKEYQKNRILVLFNPDLDPFNAGYHVIQSKIAIGSGGLIGKGLFGGTQSQLNFLPENHTDFIFAVLGEETGWVGAILLLLLYFILLYRGLQIARTTKDMFGRYIAVGIVSMWLFQIFVNIGMTVGLMPVTGIPLPFLSYGVSALTVNLCSVGLLLNIYQQRKEMLFYR